MKFVSFDLFTFISINVIFGDVLLVALIGIKILWHKHSKWVPGNLKKCIRKCQVGKRRNESKQIIFASSKPEVSSSFQGAHLYIIGLYYNIKLSSTITKTYNLSTKLSVKYN